MRSCFIFAAALAVLSTGALADVAPEAGTGSPANQIVFTILSYATIAQFKANPQVLLATYASAGHALSTQVRRLLLTDATPIDNLFAMAKRGNGPQLEPDWGKH
jgi:hypothetical protein